MDHQKQIQAFCNELDALVNRFIDEYDLEYASIIGSLAAKQHYLLNDAMTQSKLLEDERESGE